MCLRVERSDPAPKAPAGAREKGRAGGPAGTGAVASRRAGAPRCNAPEPGVRRRAERATIAPGGYSDSVKAGGQAAFCSAERSQRAEPNSAHANHGRRWCPRVCAQHHARSWAPRRGVGPRRSAAGAGWLRGNLPMSLWTWHICVRPHQTGIWLGGAVAAPFGRRRRPGVCGRGRPPKAGGSDRGLGARRASTTAGVGAGRPPKAAGGVRVVSEGGCKLGYFVD